MSGGEADSDCGKHIQTLVDSTARVRALSAPQLSRGRAQHRLCLNVQLFTKGLHISCRGRSVDDTQADANPSGQAVGLLNDNPPVLGRSRRIKLGHTILEIAPTRCLSHGNSPARPNDRYQHRGHKSQRPKNLPPWLCADRPAPLILRCPSHPRLTHPRYLGSRFCAPALVNEGPSGPEGPQLSKARGAYVLG